MNTLKALVVLLCVILLTSGAVFTQQINMDEVYKNSFRPDLPRSMQEIPYEDSDYHGNHYSPYALIRLPKTTKYDKDFIPPGFYLVKPWTENSVDYLIFKKTSQAVALVPVLKKAELPKKVKKINAELFEEGHGDYYIVSVNSGLNSYSVRLEVVK